MSYHVKGRRGWLGRGTGRDDRCLLAIRTRLDLITLDLDRCASGAGLGGSDLALLAGLFSRNVESGMAFQQVSVALIS